jgi:arginyl-tRNA synthetase
MKNIISKLIALELKKNDGEILNLIEIPPNSEMGDFSFPCFSLAKILKKNPMEISKELVEKLRKKLPKEISNIDFKGGYINFFTNKKILAENFLKEIFSEDFGKNNTGKNKVITIDLSAPNIAKPFGIGHLRSTIIGNSISNIAKANGFKTIKINYLGDWGTQFGKLILAYKKWGNEKKLEKNPLTHLQELYVKVNADETLDDSARAEFKKLEDGDKENLKLWKKFKELSIKEFEKIYELLNVKFDVISGESEYNNKMDYIIELLKEKKLIKKDDGAEIIDLEKEFLGVALIRKSDGTSLYVTRDLAAIIDRKEKYNFDKMIYEVGQEQTLHFKQLFKILEKLEFKWAKDCIHVAHGLYLDKDGKKFATRKGKTILMKDILDEVISKSKKSLEEKENIPKEEIETRAIKIALSAIFYGDLKNSPDNNILFDPDKFLSFEGDTGPYLLYSYARANSILKKITKKIKKVEIPELKEQEIKLIKKINHFPEIVKKSYEHLAPNIVANYSFELSQIFNEFYHSCPVIGNKEESFRLKLVDAFRITLKKSLDLLGIDTLEEM